MVHINLQFSFLPDQLEKQWHQTFYDTAAKGSTLVLKTISHVKSRFDGITVLCSAGDCRL